jgi:superoxide dismutase
MSFALHPLPYSKDSFGKIISVETFEYHYGKHHQTYVTNLNNLAKGTEWEKKSVEEIIHQLIFCYVDARMLRFLTMLLSIGIILSIGIALLLKRLSHPLN